MSNILIIGGNGMAGHMIRQYLEQKGFNVSYTLRKASDDMKNVYSFDATDCSKLDYIIQKSKPNYIINAIGILNQDAQDNKSTAIKVNSLFPHILDEKSFIYCYKLIHISTDFVFSGRKGKYKEEDIPDAKSFYGKTKALGEINNNRNITIRTSIIGPEIRNHRIGLFDWFINQKGEINGYTNALWTGVTTLQLAKSIVEVIEKEICGIIHLVNGKTISKYELLLLMKEYFNVDVDISPNGEYFCDKSLYKKRSDYNICVPDYKIMLKELREWLLDK